MELFSNYKEFLSDKTVMGIYDKEKESLGRFVTYVWIGSGIFLFATTEGASFISIKGLIFFGPGTFVSALVLGILFYLAIRIFSKIYARLIRNKLEKTNDGSSLSTQIVKLVDRDLFINIFGFSFFIIEIILVYISAKWLFTFMFR